MALAQNLGDWLKGSLGLGRLWQPSDGGLRERALSCLPEAIRRVLLGRRRLLIVRTLDDHATLELETGLERQPLGELGVAGPASLPPEVAKQGDEPQRTTELRLPRGAVLIRSLSFPAQARANLTQVLRYELDRLTPFEASDVVFDYVLQPGAKPGGRVSLDLAVCPRGLVDVWLARMRELGLPVDRITWESAWPGANLLSAAERPRPPRVRLRLATLMLLAAGVLLVAVLVTPIWQKQYVASRLEAELKEIRGEAIAVDDLRQELEQARQGSTVVLQEKLDQAPILELLRELTDRIPEDTWIQNLEVNEDQVDLRGESGQATALIALLEQAPGIDGVSFKSPVTQIARTGKERFNISFRYTKQRGD